MGRDGGDQTPSQSDPLKDLERRLEEARARAGLPPQRGAKASEPDGAPAAGMGAGMRIAVDLVAALAVGVGLGWLLDTWLGTAPWLLLVFFCIGAAAGFLNVYRTYQELEKQARQRRAERRDPGAGDPGPGA